MKRHIKLIVFIVSLLSIFAIFKLFSKQNSKIIYIPLGDSIAEGMTPYHSIDYGYADYVKDYLKSNDKLSFYTKKYTKSGYTIQDVINDINNNKVVEEDGKKLYLKEILRESDLVTLTVGANNFIKGLSINDISNILTNIENTKKEVDNISDELKELLLLIKKYAKNQIIVTGYFNPLPRLEIYKQEMDEVIKYFNNEIESMCDEMDITYVDIFDILDNKELFSNPLDVHPSKKGYELISEEIIKSINS